jgi:hypothetical protein
MPARFPHWEFESQRGCSEKSESVRKSGELHFRMKEKERRREETSVGWK